jgi:Phosphopantetheinyl transferase (holo-ACP synthase)
MIGNDIVDLKQASLKSNWERPGFIKKVFSADEQTLIKDAEDPFETVWRIWSMKESAYKLFLQKNSKAKREFYPSKIKTKILTPKKGEVFLNNAKILTQTHTHSSYIFTTALSDSNILNETAIFYLPKKNYQFQSYFTRQKLLDYIAKQNQFKQEKLELRKGKNNIPKLYYRAKLLPLAFSLTHHGNYGGFSISTLSSD